MCLLKLLVLLSIFSVALGENGAVEKSGVPLVTGGSDSHNQDYSKNIVSLRFKNPRKFWGDNHFCGGTYIAADVVLTAAHCLFNWQTNETFKPHELTVVSGSPDRFKHTPPTIEVKVREVIHHELYINSFLPRYDIGVLKLEERVTEIYPESAEILPTIQIPLEAYIRCTVAGWGSIFEGGILPPILLYANVTVWSSFECKIKHPGMFLYNGVICVNDEEDTHLTGGGCHGDSGGPLICNGKLAGIASFVIRYCGKKGHPTVYTNVYYYRRWIERNSANVLKVPSFIIVAMTVLLLQ